jgi:phasin family protein
MTSTATDKPRAAATTMKAPEAMKEGFAKMAKDFEAAAAFNKENVEALVKSSKVAAKAAETVTAEIAAYSKKRYEDGMAAAKDMIACKSIGELVEKQTEFGKVSMEGLVAQTAKLNDMYAAAAKDAIAPLTARFNAAVQMAMSPRA